MLHEIDQIVRREIGAEGPGVAIAVVKDAWPVHMAGYGKASLEWDCPVQPNTVFRLASITKQFTAVAILLLECQGKLHLDDTIQTYLPDYPTHGRTITITHLLNHTSGIKSYTALDNAITDIIQKDMSSAELLPYFKDLPLEFEPGTRFRYNNSGYHLLGLIIEAITGMSYERFIHEAIFQPLNMHDSYYMRNETIIPRRADGYAKTADGYRHAMYLNMEIPYAAGSLGSTAEDLIRWDVALREGRLLDATTQELMYTPTQLSDSQVEPYGFGFRTASYEGHRFVGHGGGIPGFHTLLIRFIDDQAMIAVLANAEETDVERITRKIARLLFDLPPIAHTPVTLSTLQLDKTVGAYTTEDGLSIKVARDGERLTLHDPLEQRLFPTSETAYYTREDDELEAHFSNEQHGVFHTLELHIPMYRTILALRNTEM